MAGKTTDKLTDPAAKNAAPKDKPYKLADGRGLYLEVMPNGAKYWRLKFRFGGKETPTGAPTSSVACASACQVKVNSHRKC
jgi:hypothetical protein